MGMKTSDPYQHTKPISSDLCQYTKQFHLLDQHVNFTVTHDLFSNVPRVLTCFWCTIITQRPKYIYGDQIEMICQ
jgi:hypothetical protein